MIPTISFLYYFVKPYMPRALQRRIRKIRCESRLRKYSSVWPIDRSAGEKPKDWMGWPGGKQFALVLTHDVESAKGQKKCLKLAALEEKYGFRSSFNFVIRRYKDNQELRNILADKGFEIGIHGLYHNGLMYASKGIFKLHARRINEYIRKWNVSGFRSPSMFHNLDWMHHLDILYDASTFDTDPFEPQPDGLRTIFPIFVRRSGSRGFVEMPYTLPQDHALFILLKEKSIDVWKKKLDWIAEQGGMALILTHPDYMNFDGSQSSNEEFPASFYEELLEYIKNKYSDRYWHALPKEIADYWRNNY